MHSSRMRTVRLSGHLGGKGVCRPRRGGVSSQRKRGCLPWGYLPGGVCQRVCLPRVGVSVQRGVSVHY